MKCYQNCKQEEQILLFKAKFIKIKNRIKFDIFYIYYIILK
jgi:hypothetical protein